MKNIISILICVFVCLIFVSSCTEDSIYENENPYSDVDQHLTYLDKSVQRQGDPSKGMEYLLTGNYVSSGIPADLFNSVFPSGQNHLNRDGKNIDVPFDYTQITHANGTEIVSPNCMQCHAGYVNDQFVLGVSNMNADFTFNNSSVGALLDLQIQFMYGLDSDEFEAYENFSKAVKSTSDFLITETVGSNSADKLALVLGAHRDKNTLKWLDDPQYPIPAEVIPADVPAWWLLKKKNAMFSTGIGRGDFARIMMASSVLTLQDTTEARRIDTDFIDVASFIRSIKAPKFPGEVDMNMANQGKILFEGTCAKCHGTYGEEESYPNVIVSHDLLETDRSLASSNFAYKEFADWYNTSWFSQSEYGGSIVPESGYVAPPLDGIWATAPYLHNGSIPNLESLLDSKKRTPFWRRAENENGYDFEKLGLVVTVPSVKEDKFTYDTSILGYSNSGHYFSDFLTSVEKKYLLEYLKTL